MEGSSPKRRRTSPRLSGPSSPTRDAPTEGLGSSPRRQRPSFASPTRSSMARFNPEILERRLSQSPPKRPPVSRNSPLRQPPQRLSLPPSEQSATFTRNRSPTRPSPENAPGDDTAAGSEQDQRESAEPPPRTKGVKTGLAAAPRRSLPRPNPRPLPPPAPDAEADLNPFLGNTLRRSPQTGIAIPSPPSQNCPLRYPTLFPQPLHEVSIVVARRNGEEGINRRAAPPETTTNAPRGERYRERKLLQQELEKGGGASRATWSGSRA
ncbi:hypothetical protein V2G26_011415 [Clonostachys chloroleuca]